MKKDFLNYKRNAKEEINKYIDNSKDSQLLKNLKSKILDLIFEKIKEENNFKNNKIYFDMNLWIVLHKHELFKKNVMIIHNFINELKSKSLISKFSRNYPKNQFIFSTNPLNQAFLACKIKDFDRIIEIRDNLIKKIESYSLSDRERNLEFEINLFIYFKLFSIIKIPNNYFQYLKRENIIYIDNKIIFVIKENSENTFIPLHSIIFDSFTSNIIEKFFPKNITSVFDVNEYIFSKNYNFYNIKLKKFCNENLLNLIDANNAIQFEFQLKNSSLALTLVKNVKYPRISLYEIEKLFPKSVKEELLQIETNNLNIYRNINQTTSIDDELEEDNDDELNLQKELNFKFQVYDKLKEIKKVPLKEQLMPNYCQKWFNFMNTKTNQADRFIPIYSHLLYLLNKYKNKEISRTTLQNYLHIIFDFCFNILIKSVNIEDVLKEIDRKLKNSNLNPKVQQKYQNRVMLFFNKEFSLGFDKIKSVINYNRSTIFIDELNIVIKKLIYEDKKIHKDNFYIYSRAVYVILAYYTGLRKGELYSRLLKDVYYIEDNKFYINVNIEGINLINKKEDQKIVSLKNSNAKRAFEFEINNSYHLKIVKNYNENLNNYKIKFLFPGITKNNKIYKYRVIKISKIDRINTILQKTTKRYTVIHSFRHTYVTNEIKKILSKKEKKIEDMYNLIYKIGHNDPETTIKNYAHLDLYFLDM